MVQAQLLTRPMLLVGCPMAAFLPRHMVWILALLSHHTFKVRMRTTTASEVRTLLHLQTVYAGQVRTLNHDGH